MDDRRFPYPRFLQVPFIFVPDGCPETPEVALWKADHPGSVTFRATFTPRPPEPGQPPLRVFLSGGPEPLELACTLDEPKPEPPPGEDQSQGTEPVAAPWPVTARPLPGPPPAARHARTHSVAPPVLLAGDPRPAGPRPGYLRRTVPPPGPPPRAVPPPGARIGAGAPRGRPVHGTETVAHPLTPEAISEQERARLAYYAQLARWLQQSPDAAPSAETECAAEPQGEASPQPPRIAEDVAATLRRWVAEAEAELGLSGGGTADASARRAVRTQSRHDATSQAQSPSAALLGTGTARTDGGSVAPSGGEVAGAGSKSSALQAPKAATRK